jgi:CDGSH-type Zn-finger protein
MRAYGPASVRPRRQALDPAGQSRCGRDRGRRQSLSLRRIADGIRGWDIGDGNPGGQQGHVNADGPTYLRGKLTLRHGESELEDTRIALCRCGASQHKPFCDNSHKKIGFKDPGTQLAHVAAPPDTDFSAPLTIRQNPNGPLVCTGPLTLHGSDGHTAFSDTNISLSLRRLAKQPYCDGTHKKIGFKS